MTAYEHFMLMVCFSACGGVLMGCALILTTGAIGKLISLVKRMRRKEEDE